jgi:hypothetical protein
MQPCMVFSTSEFSKMLGLLLGSRTSTNPQRRMDQNFNDVDTLAPATSADVQDLWNRYKSLGQVKLTRARDCRRPMSISRSVCMC